MHFFPHPPDPNAHYMMSPEMEQWRYMEMQRQWMARQQQHMVPHPHQQPHPHQHPKGLKRPLPNKPTPLTNNSVASGNHLPGESEKQASEEPPMKQPKLSTKENESQDIENTHDSSSPHPANSNETTMETTSN